MTTLHVRTDADLLADIDYAAARANLTRSQWVKGALKSVLQTICNKEGTKKVLSGTKEVLDETDSLKDFLGLHTHTVEDNAKPPRTPRVGKWTKEQTALLAQWGVLSGDDKPRKMPWDQKAMVSALKQGFTYEDIAWCLTNWRDHPYLQRENVMPSISRILSNGMLPEWNVLLQARVKGNKATGWVVEGEDVWVFYADGDARKVPTLEDAKAIVGEKGEK